MSNKTCKNQHCEKAFLITSAESDFYKRKRLPDPSECPSCRHKRRMALRSERQLYKRNCAHCQATTLSVYPETAPYIIQCQKCFWEQI